MYRKSSKHRNNYTLNIGFILRAQKLSTGVSGKRYDTETFYSLCSQNKISDKQSTGKLGDSFYCNWVFE